METATGTALAEATSPGTNASPVLDLTTSFFATADGFLNHDHGVVITDRTTADAQLQVGRF